MSAPVLVPPTEERVSEDEEAFREIVRRFDDHQTCSFGECSAVATMRTVCRGCGEFTGLLCGLHAFLVSMSVGVVTHLSCGARGRACDLIRLVPL